MRDPELLGELPDDVCRRLEIDTVRRVVMIEHATIAHIFHRRSFADATMIVNVLARRRFDPIYCGRQLHDARLFFVVERIAKQRRRALIALKFVRSAASESGDDEVWVTTGYIVGDSTLRQMLEANRFVMQFRTSDR